MLLVGAQNGLEVAMKWYSQQMARLAPPILVCLIMLATREVACGLRKARQLLKKPAGIPLCRWQRALAEIDSLALFLRHAH